LPAFQVAVETPDSLLERTIELDEIMKASKNRKLDFELNLGKVIDTLNKNYPHLFYEAPNYDIYTAEIEVRDPTGVQFHGINAYKQLFSLLRFFRNLVMDSVEIRHKLVYDWAHNQVRVTWYTRIFMKGQDQPLHVDGISVYSVSDDGFVFSHHVEKIIVNGIPAVPPYGIRWLDIQQLLRVNGGGDFKVPATIPMQSSFSYSKEEGAAELVAKDKKKTSMFDWPFPEISPPQSCESSFDCDYPQNCCDFIAFKMCCNGGLGVGREYAPEYVPIPIPVDDPYRRY